MNQILSNLVAMLRSSGSELANGGLIENSAQLPQMVELTGKSLGFVVGGDGSDTAAGPRGGWLT